MSDDVLARRIYAEFKAKPESARIATEFALIHLSRLVSKIKPQTVLEVGAGIGTITKMLLIHPDRPQVIVTTEDHPVCLRELEANLKGLDKTGLSLIGSPNDLDLKKKYDLVIFDGTLRDERQYDIFSAGTWCFVEGRRTKTKGALNDYLRKKGLSIEFENFNRPGKKYKFLTKRRVLGLRMPSFSIKSMKGYSVGQVVSLPN